MGRIKFCVTCVVLLLRLLLLSLSDAITRKKSFPSFEAVNVF